jgi:hypothetical protein
VRHGHAATHDAAAAAARSRAAGQPFAHAAHAALVRSSSIANFNFYAYRHPPRSPFLLPHADTPYSNGFFAFDLLLPADYPNSPPKCKVLTTAGGTVRFNP